MKVFICIDHETFWPVGGVSVVVAHDEARAREILGQALRDKNLYAQKPFTLQELDTKYEHAEVLNDGEY